jgi:uncharacterized protein (TIGR02284 family)
MPNFADSVPSVTRDFGPIGLGLAKLAGMVEHTNLGSIQIGVTSEGGTSVLDKIDNDLAHELNHLVHMANDLSLAYGTAIRRVENDVLRARLQQLDKSHDRYRIELQECVVAMGHKPARGGDVQGLLERGRVIVGQLRGDVGILSAMAANEEVMSQAYRDALGRPILPQKQRAIVERALEHELGIASTLSTILNGDSEPKTPVESPPNAPHEIEPEIKPPPGTTPSRLPPEIEPQIAPPPPSEAPIEEPTIELPPPEIEPPVQPPSPQSPPGSTPPIIV